MCTSTETKVGSANCEECIRDFGRDHFTCSMCTSTETKVGSANCEECIRDFGRDHFTCSMCTSTGQEVRVAQHYGMSSSSSSRHYCADCADDETPSSFYDNVRNSGSSIDWTTPGRRSLKLKN